MKCAMVVFTRCKILRDGSTEASVRRLVLDWCKQWLQLLRRVETGDFTGRQQTVGQFKELRINKLMILEQQDDLLTINASRLHCLQASIATKSVSNSSQKQFLDAKFSLQIQPHSKYFSPLMWTVTVLYREVQ